MEKVINDISKVSTIKPITKQIKSIIIILVVSTIQWPVIIPTIQST